jgi:hypothetical protein
VILDNDCVCSCCCPCLVAAQILRHITDYSLYPATICTDHGIPPYALNKVFNILEVILNLQGCYVFPIFIVSLDYCSLILPLKQESASLVSWFNMGCIFKMFYCHPWGFIMPHGRTGAPLTRRRTGFLVGNAVGFLVGGRVGASVGALRALWKLKKPAASPA